MAILASTKSFKWLITGSLECKEEVFGLLLSLGVLQSFRLRDEVGDFSLVVVVEAIDFGE